MLGFQARSNALLSSAGVKSDLLSQNHPIDLKPIAPFDKNVSPAALKCFDRETHKPIPIELLKTYREAISQYHLRSETKLLNDNYLDCGATIRQHVEVVAIRHIGKESNRWEEQFYLGSDKDAEFDYGISTDEIREIIKRIRRLAKELGQRKLAALMGIPQQTLSRWLRSKTVKITDRIIRLFARHKFT
jgi:DNA-binding transcriptional regulator YiaG